MTNDQIVDLLRKFRREFVRIARAKEGGSSQDLGGWCALCSYTIFRNLKRKGYRPSFCANSDHAFLKWRGHYIDITITQFGKFPAVYFSKKPVRLWHRNRKTTRSAKDVWRKLCRGWSMPLKVNDPRIKRMIETF